jgi:hypothetical protein
MGVNPPSRDSLAAPHRVEDPGAAAEHEQQADHFQYRHPLMQNARPGKGGWSGVRGALVA